MTVLNKIKIVSVLSFFFTFGLLAGYFIENKFARKIIHVDLDAGSNIVYDENTKYPFLHKEYSDYICNLSKELKIDSDLAVAILMVENPEFNPEATNKNSNGSMDLGFFQLNDSCIYGSFLKSYWDMDNIEFNPFNWKHSTFLALHHIEYLVRTLKVQDDAIMAYNCGMTRVLSGKAPASTKQYLAKVRNNLRLLRNCSNAVN